MLPAQFRASTASAVLYRRQLGVGPVLPARQLEPVLPAQLELEAALPAQLESGAMLPAQPDAAFSSASLAFC
jgi:hypothetical protein